MAVWDVRYGRSLFIRSFGVSVGGGGGAVMGDVMF